MIMVSSTLSAKLELPHQAITVDETVHTMSIYRSARVASVTEDDDTDTVAIELEPGPIPIRIDIRIPTWETEPADADPAVFEHTELIDLNGLARQLADL